MYVGVQVQYQENILKYKQYLLLVMSVWLTDKKNMLFFHINYGPLRTEINWYIIY